MTETRRLGAILLVLAAGAIAYPAYAIGDGGPLTAFGHSDADIQAVNAWQQFPIHVVLAVSVGFAGSKGFRLLAAMVATVVLFLFLSWAALLVAVDIGSLGDYTDLADIGVAVTLLVLYAGVAAFAWPVVDDILEAPYARS